jgi:DNA-binding CsgD family transcriptional regulator
MRQTNELDRLLSTIKLYDQKIAEIPTREYEQYLDLFRSPAFKKFTQHSPLLICVYNYPEQKYEFMSESVMNIAGVKPEDFTTELGVQVFIDLLKPESLEIMISEITSKMLGCCLQHKGQVENLRFSACVEFKTKAGKEGWLLLHNHMLSSDSNGFPILACTTGIEVTAIKKDSYIYYAGSLCNENETTILYSKNLTGTKTPVNFSKREIQIIQLLCKGETTKEIADKLCVSFDTIKKQRSNILDKSGAKNTAELINFSTMTGII